MPGAGTETRADSAAWGKRSTDADSDSAGQEASLGSTHPWPGLWEGNEAQPWLGAGEGGLTLTHLAMGQPRELFPSFPV